MKKSQEKKIRFQILTAVPGVFDSYLKESIIGRAIKNKLLEVLVRDLREETNDKRGTIDDKAFGGGPGMVLKFEPIFKLVKKIKNKLSRKKTRIILFSTRGRKFNNKEAKRLSLYEEVILICGRYEGVDERVAQVVADEELSIGDYVLTGGELPALVVIDAVSRMVSGVLGKDESLEEIKGSYPVYTRPEEIEIKDLKTGRKRKLKVPEVLLSGNHKKIEEWRLKKRGSEE